MIAKRLAAVAAAVVLIAAAIVIRDRLIDDRESAPEPPTEATVLVCVTELETVCRAAGAGLTVRVAEAGATLTELAGDADPTLWLTFDPFPAMVDALRTRDPVGYETKAIVGSPIALVGAPGAIATVGTECGEPVDWRCLAELDLGVGFARDASSGVGLLALTQAALGYGAPGIPVDDARFQVYVRDLLRSVPASRLSGGTAVATIQNRPSAMDVAVGAEAQVTRARRAGFGIAYAAPMLRADVVLAVPPRVRVPDGLTDRLAAALTDAGWAAEGAPANTAIDPLVVLAVRSVWEEVA